MNNRKVYLVWIAILMVFPSLFSQEDENENKNEKVIITDADFEKEIKKNTYFPLANNTKKIAWKNTFYHEKIENVKTFNGKEYIACFEEWESGRVKKIYLREEDGLVLQYEACCTMETIRFNEDYKKGESWESANKKIKYKIITYLGKLKTPYKNYNNLLVIRKIYGRSVYDFYYKKKYGYVGATKRGVLISYVIPRNPTKEEKKEN